MENISLAKRLKHLARRQIIALGGRSAYAARIESRLEEILPPDGEYKYTLLALQPERFRKDLEIFNRIGFRVLLFPHDLQSWLQEFFWTRGVDMEEYFNPPPGSATERAQARIRPFLADVLAEIARRQSIDCLIGAGLHYLDSLDWGAAAMLAGIPYVVLHRECFQTNKGQFERTFKFGRKLHKLQADFAIFHNEITRKAFVDSGHTPADRSAALGCMRMDDFVRRVEKTVPGKRERKRILLFSFTHCTGIGGMCNAFTDGSLGFVNLFEETHRRVAKLAKEHPEWDVVMKLKWGGFWYDRIDEALAKQGLFRDDIPNLTVAHDLDAQELIFDSDVVVGYGSTALAESGLAGKPVIIPCFAECLEEKYQDYIQLKNEFQAFDIAESPDDLERLILHRLEHPEIPDEQMRLRRELFERYVSPLDARATERYAEAVARVIAEKEAGR